MFELINVFLFKYIFFLNKPFAVVFNPGHVELSSYLSSLVS